MDFYQACDILGLNAFRISETAIKTAYRKLALKYHPDRNLGVDVSKEMSNLNEANEVLLAHLVSIKYDTFEKQLVQRLISFGAYSSVVPLITAINDGFFTHEQLHDFSDAELEYVSKNIAFFRAIKAKNCQTILNDPMLFRMFAFWKLPLIKKVNAYNVESFSNALSIFRALNEYFLKAENIEKLGRFEAYEVHGAGKDGEGKLEERNSALKVLAQPSTTEIGKDNILIILFYPILCALFLKKANPELITHPNCIELMKQGVLSLKDLLELKQHVLDVILEPDCVDAIQEGIFDKTALIAFANSNPSKYFESLRQVTSFNYIESLRRLKTKQGDRYNPKEAVQYAYHKIASLGLWTKTDNISSAVYGLPISPYRQAARTAVAELKEAIQGAKELFYHAHDPAEAEKRFVVTCLQAINEARPKLERYHNVRQMLLDIANVIISIITLCIPQMVVKRWRLFEEVSGQRAIKSLNELDDVIESLDPSPVIPSEAAGSPKLRLTA